MRRRLPALHLVTDDAVLAAPDFTRRAEAALRAAGARAALHLRGPRTTGSALYRLAERLRPVAGECGALLLVNDRIDVALAAGADGCQLGARSLAAADARGLLGRERLLGLSVHDPAEAAAALAAEPDFLLVGTLYPTASHPGRAGAGAERLREFAGCGAPGTALVAIGGITPERVAAVRAAGAAGVAVLGGVWHAPEPVRAVRAYLDRWEEDDE